MCAFQGTHCFFKISLNMQQVPKSAIGNFHDFHSSVFEMVDKLFLSFNTLSKNLFHIGNGAEASVHILIICHFFSILITCLFFTEKGQYCIVLTYECVPVKKSIVDQYQLLPDN